MKNIILFLFFAIPILGCAQYPPTANKQRLGWATTGDGLVYRDAGYPSYTPNSRNNAYVYMDTVAKRYYHFANGAWYDLSDEKYIHRQDQSVLALAVRDSITTYDRLFVAMEITSGASSDRGVQLPVTALDSTYAGRVVRVSSLDSSGTYNVFVSSSSPDGLLVNGALATTYYLAADETAEFQLYVFDTIYQWRLVHTNEINILTSLSATPPLQYNNTTGVFSIPLGTSSIDGYLSATDRTNFQTAYTNRITSLTTTGSSGAATLLSNVLNVPNYTLAGLGGVGGYGNGVANQWAYWSDANTVTTSNQLIRDANRVSLGTLLNLKSYTTVGLPASPIAGDVVYNTTLGNFQGYFGSSWRPLSLWNISGNDINYTTGNVNIGTTAPIYAATLAVYKNSTSGADRLFVVNNGTAFPNHSVLEVYASRIISFGNLGQGATLWYNVATSAFQAGTGGFKINQASTPTANTYGISYVNAFSFNGGGIINTAAKISSSGTNEFRAYSASLSGYNANTSTASQGGFSFFLDLNPASGYYTASGDMYAFSTGTQSASGFRVNNTNAKYYSYGSFQRIEQIGTASGITRGFWANDNLVAAYDYRAFESNNDVGKQLYLEGDANSYINPTSLPTCDTCSTFILSNSGILSKRQITKVGNLDGVGVVNQVAFFLDTDSIAGNQKFRYDGDMFSLNVPEDSVSSWGVTSRSSHINSTTGASGIVFSRQNAQAAITLMRIPNDNEAQGTANAIFAGIRAEGWTGSSYNNKNVVEINTPTAWTPTSTPFSIVINTNPVGSTTVLPRFSITEDGTVLFNAYGAGAKTAPLLSKTRYAFTEFATDGTLMSRRLSAGSGISLTFAGDSLVIESTGVTKEAYTNQTSTSSPLTLSIGDNLINQGGTQATFTFNLPGSPVDGTICRLVFINAVTICSVGGGTILGASVTTATAGDVLEYKYYTSGTTWVRIQ